MHNIANKFAYIKKKQYFCALNCVSVRLCAKISDEWIRGLAG